jgi:endonuclease/exonuclease/phosphatase family metal-dependent hydrolase
MRLDGEEREDEAIRPHGTALGSALATIRRVAEAAALRVILTKVMKKSDVPVVVMGDLNDSEHSNALNVLTQQPSYRLEQSSRVASSSDNGLYMADTLQQFRSLSDVSYTHIHENFIRESLDHILVSEQFYDYSRKRIWCFKDMRIWNDHVEDEDRATSDHGVVAARFDYWPQRPD